MVRQTREVEKEEERGREGKRERERERRREREGGREGGRERGGGGAKREEMGRKCKRKRFTHMMSYTYTAYGLQVNHDP